MIINWLTKVNYSEKFAKIIFNKSFKLTKNRNIFKVFFLIIDGLLLLKNLKINYDKYITEQKIRKSKSNLMHYCKNIKS